MSPFPIAVVAGHICLDITPSFPGSRPESFDEIFLPGHLISSGPLTYSPGGSVSNTGLAMLRLGIKTRLAAKIGSDLPGKILRHIIAGYSKPLSRDLRTDSTQSTSYSIIISYPGTDRIFIHDSGANNSFTSTDIPFDTFKHAGLFHFGYPPVMRSVFQSTGDELFRIFANAKGLGLVTSLDMAFADPDSKAGQVDWRAILTRVLPFVDIFMPSMEEITCMLHRELYQELCEAAVGADILPLVTPGMLSRMASELIQMGAGVVGLKMGYRGLYLRTGDSSRMRSLGISTMERSGDWSSKEFWAPCFQVKVAGTTGAGDATIAGFLAAFLRGCCLTECIQMAVAVGACCVEAGDSLGGVLTWEETSARIDNGWLKHILEINEHGWRFHPDKGLWERTDLLE